MNTGYGEINIHSCYSLVKINFVPICVCKNNQQIWHHNSGLDGPWNRGIIAHQTPHFRRPPKHVNNKGPLVFAQTFCTAWFISLENLHIYSKTYVFSNTFEGFRPKCTFRGCLSKYRRTFIVYMFRWPPEVWSLMSDNALISGTGKVGMPITHICMTSQINRPVSQIRAPSCGLSRTSRKFWQDYSNCYIICFEHKTQYLLIRAPYTRIVVFWHISNIPPMISQSQISCNTPTFYIAAIFVKYCYTTGSWLL